MLRELLATLILGAGATALGGAVQAAFPARASAALPDGRVYEQVSPPDKNGNVVVAGSFGLAGADGDSVVFVGSGAMGAAVSSTIGEFVARRSASGWATGSALPRQLGVFNAAEGPPSTVIPSSDFSRFLFGAFKPYVSAEPLDEQSSSNIFLSSDPTLEPAWVGEPVLSSPNFSPIPLPGQNTERHNYVMVGGTPNLSRVYFTYAGTLAPQDASRAPHVGRGLGEPTDAWGFYEWTEGRPTEAGVLPNGALDPFGAVPAAIAGDGIPTGPSQESFARNGQYVYAQAQVLDNEVSADGSRAFFVSPDPVASTLTNEAQCEVQGPCTNAPPELYVRKIAPDGTKSTVLVSQSQVPGHIGEAAPTGVVNVENAPSDNTHHVGATDIYASPDGSHALFKSRDQLTGDAPSDGSVKEYDFDVNSGTLRYLPGVAGPVVVSSNDGSSFIFENTAATPAELDSWTSGSPGGQIKTITELPSPPNTGPPFAGALDVSGGRASADGSVFVFRTNSPLPGGFNNAGGFAQVYRYVLAANQLSCVSCPPVGVLPSGDAHLSSDSAEGARSNGNPFEPPITTLDARVISSDGSRFFFDTPSPLVPLDTNGKRDVYEWENGHAYLISSGKGADDSAVVDSSPDGNDVFFTTSYGLVPGDVDEAYDVYDARIPRPGDTLPPSPAPCQGEVCRAPPSTSPNLAVPASATFNGVGNLTPVESNAAAKKTVVKKKRKCRSRRGKHKRICSTVRKVATKAKMRSDNERGPR
jgi:hypothetical protein